MRHSTARHVRHPVFDIVLVDQGRSLTWLARETRYSHGHVKNMAAGLQPAGPRFRAACARILGMDESVLFHGDGSSASQPEGTPNDGSDSDRADTVAAASVPAA